MRDLAVVLVFAKPKNYPGKNTGIISLGKSDKNSLEFFSA